MSNLTYSLNDTSNTTIGSDSTPALPQSASSSGPDTTSIFRGFVIIIGVVGATANGFVLFALLSKSLRQKNTNILIVNQSSIDLYCCVMLVLTSAIKLPQPFYRGAWGDAVCVLFGSEMLIWMGLTSSVAGLSCITLERYWKIIHPIGHRKFFRKWMLYLVMVLTWISGFFMELSGAFTSKVIDGACIPYGCWANPVYEEAYTYVDLFWTFIVPLTIFIYCYGCILYKLSSKGKVLNADEGTQTAADVAKAASSRRGQANIIKTLVMVAVVFFLCWCPNTIYNLLANLAGNVAFRPDIYYGSVFIVYLNLCANPFIYATKHDAVKDRLKAMFGLKAIKSSAVDADVSGLGKTTKTSQI